MVQDGEEIQMTPEEAIDYIFNKVNVGDTLELSYNRIYAPGEVISIVEPDEETGEGVRVNLELNGKMLNDCVEVDLNNIKEELIEVHHIHDGEEIVIEIL
ncbi:MAG: DUF2097 domain-containing protein [Methanobrevibacter sp.]